MTATAPGSASDQAPLPLFYRSPEPLSSAVHGEWRIKGGDLAFAAEAHVAPLVAAEFGKAQRWYPIVFTAEKASPLAVLGLERRNLFVVDGAWAPEVYIPAYVRRYPFGFMATSEADRFALAIDAASEAVVKGGEEGEPLFTAGEPSPLTREALQFCDAFRGEAQATTAFCEALTERDLLVDRRADATTADGRRYALDGFRVIDPKKLAELDADTVVDWHRKGWLALAHFHLASLERFQDLMTLQGKTAPQA